MQELGGDLLGALGAARCGGRSSATHAILPLLATDGGVREQVRSGLRLARAALRSGLAGRLLAAGVRARARGSSRSCREAGVRTVCVELTNRFGLGAREHLRPILTESGLVLVPVDRATMSLVWSEHGYPAAGPYRDYHHHTVHHHNPWSNDGGAYDHAAAQALAREHAADFVTRTRARLREHGAGLPGGGLVVCALDTELLGHWWYEGVDWLGAVVEECARQGLALVALDDALERCEPQPAGGWEQWPASSWGQDGDLSTWSGPAVADLAFSARAAELRVLAAGDRARARRRARAARPAGQRLGVPGLQGDGRPLRAHAARRAPPGPRPRAGRGSSGRARRAAQPRRRRRPHEPAGTAVEAAPRGRESARAWRGAAGRYSKRISTGASRMRITRAGTPATTAFSGIERVSTALVPIDRVVADRDAAQDAGAVADPHVVPDVDVALVDALLADRALDLGDAVVEVDQHHAVGDDALAADRDVLEGRDRALLARSRSWRRCSPRPRARGSCSRGRSRPSARCAAWRCVRSRASRRGQTKQSPSVCRRLP